MKKHLFYISFFLLLVACKHSNNAVKPAHSGAAGEIIVVCSEDVWSGVIDSVCRDVFQYYLPMLPQPEPAFTILHYTPEQFSMILERHRNIIQIVVDPNRKDPDAKFNLLKDKWSKEQLVLDIEARTAQEVSELLYKNGPDVVAAINAKENERLSWLFSSYSTKPIMSMVSKKFGADIIIPKGFELAKDSLDFLWLKREKSRNLSGNMYYIIQNLVVYTRPYDSDSSFSDHEILQHRDRFVKMIPGPSKGSYMTTVYSFQEMDLYPEGTNVDINGNYGRFIRGLWKMENDFMGGPFISLSTYDEANNRILTIEGDVFAPKFDKREYLRELESIIFSLKFNLKND